MIDELLTEFPHRTRLNTGAQLTPRLESMCKIIGEQGALRFDQVQRWLGLLSPATDRMKEAGILSTERTRKILRPWIDQELLAYKIFQNKQKGWLWLTSKGLKYFDVQLRYYEPVFSTLAHLYAVNAIRYMIALRRSTDTWRSERTIRAEHYANKFAHLPDAELLSSNSTTVNAIEVELTVKSEKRLQEILFDLAANKRYSTLWYFAPPHVHDVLEKNIRKLPAEHRKRFVLYDLEGKRYNT